MYMWHARKMAASCSGYKQATISVLVLIHSQAGLFHFSGIKLQMGISIYSSPCVSGHLP